MKNFVTFLCALMMFIASDSGNADDNSPKPLRTEVPSAASDMKSTTAKLPISPETKIENLKKVIANLVKENETNEPDSIARENWSTYYYQTYLPERAAIQLTAFKWQQTASQNILWFVIFISTSGIIFSGYQLWFSIRTSQNLDATTSAGFNSEIEISGSYVKARSQLVGIIILILSLVFFYLFTREVYQIKFVSDDMSQSRIEVHSP